MKKVLVGGLLGGLTLFVWGAISHMALPLGLLVTFDVDASYWNWYGFPTSYLLAQVVDHTVGWLLAGLVLARVCKP